MDLDANKYEYTCEECGEKFEAYKICPWKLCDDCFKKEIRKD